MHPTNRWLLVVFLIGAIVLSACGGSPAAPAPAPTSAPAANAPAAPAPTATLAATAVPAATTAPAANASSGTLNRDPKTLVIAYQESADNVDPAQTLNVANNIVTRPIYEGLLTLKGSSLTEVEPVLAESFTTNADKSEWTFKIRKGVKFHDGGVCDAQAIYDSIARTIVNKMPTWISGALRRRGSHEDDEGGRSEHAPVQVRTAPQSLFQLGAGGRLRHRHHQPQGLQGTRKERRRRQGGGDNPRSDGTGPYKLDKFAPNDEFVLVHNPDYWRGWDDPNKFEKVIIKIYPENSTRRQLLEKGDVDIFTTPSAEDVEALQQSGNFEIGNADLIWIDYIAFNTHGSVGDPRVRQAIDYAFDYDGYIKGVRKDQGRRAGRPLPAQPGVHDPGVFVYPTDLQRPKSCSLRPAGLTAPKSPTPIIPASTARMSARSCRRSSNRSASSSRSRSKTSPRSMGSSMAISRRRSARICSGTPGGRTSTIPTIGLGSSITAPRPARMVPTPVSTRTSASMS